MVSGFATILNTQNQSKTQKTSKILTDSATSSLINFCDYLTILCFFLTYLFLFYQHIFYLMKYKYGSHINSVQLYLILNKCTERECRFNWLPQMGTMMSSQSYYNFQ